MCVGAGYNACLKGVPSRFIVVLAVEASRNVSEFLHSASFRLCVVVVTRRVLDRFTIPQIMDLQHATCVSPLSYQLCICGVCKASYITTHLYYYTVGVCIYGER
jgi:hypothetical protein